MFSWCSSWIATVWVQVNVQSDERRNFYPSPSSIRIVRSSNACSMPLFCSLYFPTSPLNQKMNWKVKMMMGLYTFISSMQIGKNSSVTWKTMGCVRSTTIFTVNFPSLDWFGWGNVWFPQLWGGKIPVSFSYWGLVLYLLNTSSL